MLLSCGQWHQLVPSEDSLRACCVLWVVPENIETVVTLFRDPRRCEFEDKDWSFSIEIMVNILCLHCMHVMHRYCLWIADL